MMSATPQISESSIYAMNFSPQQHGAISIVYFLKAIIIKNTEILKAFRPSWAYFTPSQASSEMENMLCSTFFYRFNVGKLSLWHAEWNIKEWVSCWAHWRGEIARVVKQIIGIKREKTTAERANIEKRAETEIILCRLNKLFIFSHVVLLSVYLAVVV